MKEFKKIIKAHLDKMAKADTTFAANYKKPNKNLDECVKFIFGEMRKRAQDGCAAAEDKEVYGLAMHYYNGAEKKAKTKPKVEVEAEDFAEARKKAYNKWADGEIVLSADDYTGEVQFEYVDKKEINY